MAVEKTNSSSSLAEVIDRIAVGLTQSAAVPA